MRKILKELLEEVTKLGECVFPVMTTYPNPVAGTSPKDDEDDKHEKEVE